MKKEDQRTADMIYRIARAFEFLVIAGIEKLPFLLLAVFTIGLCVDDHERLVKYSKLLSQHKRESHDVKDLVQGVIEGETRVLAASMTMEEIFKGTKISRRRCHEYFSYLGLKTQMKAANQAKIDIAEAKMKGETGAKEREGLTRQNATKIDAETKREVEVAEANSILPTKKAGWSQQAKMAEIEAQKVVAIWEAVLQQEVERKNALTKTESLKAQHLSKATVDYEIKATLSCSNTFLLVPLCEFMELTFSLLIYQK
ncbi:hypothetical protein RND71_001359 [Anisodus tanguticus]|uniref:Flotillin-like n=1 Tax=Anisodus tanguticus TaxID=243964 RepID=A0AAE1T0S7_9SOLA|nr:hypothetical protein RND71_001359 [Anisodus tanguticus]